MKLLCLLCRYSHLLLITATGAGRSTCHVSAALGMFKASVIQGPTSHEALLSPGPRLRAEGDFTKTACRGHTSVYAHGVSRASVPSVTGSRVSGAFSPAGKVRAGPGDQPCVGSTSRSPDVKDETASPRGCIRQTGRPTIPQPRGWPCEDATSNRRSRLRPRLWVKWQ